MLLSNVQEHCLSSSICNSAASFFDLSAKKEVAELQFELERQHSENAKSEERKKDIELEMEKLQVKKLRLQLELARMGASGRS